MKISVRNVVLAVGLVISVVFGATITVQLLSKDVYEVYIGDRLVGAVSDPDFVKGWGTKELYRLEAQYPNATVELDLKDVNLTQKREVLPEFQEDEVAAALASSVRPELYGTQILIDGKVIGIVKDERVAQSILDEMKKMYSPPSMPVSTASVEKESETDGEDTGKSKLETIDFVQAVSVERLEIDPKVVIDKEQALERLRAGHSSKKTYAVQKGDCVSCIAERFDVPVDVIYTNNPWIKDDFINIGDIIDLSTTQPVLSVRTIENRVDTLEIPFPVSYEEDPNMKKGQSVIRRHGELGQKKVTYKVEKVNGQLVAEHVANTEVVVEPVTEIVIRGTKLPPGVGTGKFSWPVNQAEVTSEYGKRWGRFHAGTDTVSEDRDILASDHGVVVSAGWNGGYGRAVIIDHNNGYRTLYAHMSKLNVKEGQTVEKGDKIGVMGSTGNSTGIHLHFEIEKDGENQNPLKYL